MLYNNISSHILSKFSINMPQKTALGLLSRKMYLSDKFPGSSDSSETPWLEIRHLFSLHRPWCSPTLGRLGQCLSWSRRGVSWVYDELWYLFWFWLASSIFQLFASTKKSIHDKSGSDLLLIEESLHNGLQRELILHSHNGAIRRW